MVPLKRTVKLGTLCQDRLRIYFFKIDLKIHFKPFELIQSVIALRKISFIVVSNKISNLNLILEPHWTQLIPIGLRLSLHGYQTVEE